MDEKKMAYEVTQSAEGYSYGYVILTRAEAELVAKVSNPDNWLKSNIDRWSGSFRIDLDHPIDPSEVEEFMD